jgi:hypothetical protein
MPALAARIDRVETRLGAPGAPKLVVISTAGDCHSIHRVNRDFLSLGVPFRGMDADPLEDLTAAQRSLIGPKDQIRIMVIDPRDRHADRGIDGL